MLKASKREALSKNRYPFRCSNAADEGRPKTTALIGVRCKFGNGFSQDVLIADRLDHLLLRFVLVCMELLIFPCRFTS